MIKQFGTEKELWVFTSRLNAEFGGFQDVFWVAKKHRIYTPYDHVGEVVLGEGWEDRSAELMKTWVEMYRKNPDTTIQDAVDICEGM